MTREKVSDLRVGSSNKEDKSVRNEKLMRDNKTKRAALPGDLRDEATELLLRVRFGAERSAVLDAWRRISAHHEAAVAEAEALWRQVGETQTAVEFAATTATTAPSRPAGRLDCRGVSRRTILTGALAAGSAAFVVGYGAFGALSHLFADYTTGIGEQREVALPDGSIACLNTASALSFKSDAEQRLATLVEGECLFEVVADDKRPFAVEAMGGSVQSVGAAVFTVHRQADAVRIIAVDGSVQVAAGTGAGSSLRVPAGKSVTYDDGRGLGAVEQVDAASAAAWRRGKLVFNQRPLSEVVAELERYRRGRILILFATLSNLPVTGVFDLTDPDGTLAAIEAILPVQVTRLPLLTVLS